MSVYIYIPFGIGDMPGVRDCGCPLTIGIGAARLGHAASNYWTL